MDAYDNPDVIPPTPNKPQNDPNYLALISNPPILTTSEMNNTLDQEGNKENEHIDILYEEVEQ